MNGPEWKDPIGELLRTPPPEADAVDYAAIRAAALREANRRRRQRWVLAALPLAAALVLAVSLPWHRQAPPPEVATIQPPEVVETPAVAPRPASPALFRKRVRRPHRQTDLDRRFAEFVRTQYDARHPAIQPATTPIRTENPQVSILLLEETREPNE